MKRSVLLVLSCLMFSMQASTQISAPVAANPKIGEEGLKPTVTQQKVESLVAQILSMYHYRKVPLNDSLSSKIFDKYFSEIDFGHYYFTASDVNGFEKYRYQLDNQLERGDLSAAYEIFNIYLKRFKARNAAVATLLDKPFDFSVDESYDVDREKALWAKDDKELDEVWRKAVKSQALELKLAGKADTAAVKTLKERYKTSDKNVNRLKSEDVFQLFMNAFAECVDPHTTYFNPKNAANFNIEMSQSLEGIGATLRTENNYVTIQEVITGGPASKSKQINPKDRFVGVAQGDNGAMVDIVGWETDDAVKLIRGPKGTVVRLWVLPKDAPAGSTPKEVRMVREKIKLEDQSAKKEIVSVDYEGRKYKFGLITVPMFYRDFAGAKKGEEGFRSTTADAAKFISEFKTEKVDGVVIDLRNNGGGSLTEAIDLSGLFISKGPVVQQKYSEGSIDVHQDKDPNTIYEGPLAVMVNRFSASASEIFAAAMQDYKRGIIVGEQTYGKGTVQQIVDLSQFLREQEKVGELKITTGKFYRITGESTQHKGVIPDVALPSGFSAEEYGESSQPSALPWDKIVSTAFTPYKDVTEQVLGRIKKRHDDRMKTDPDLKQLQADVEEFNRTKDQTVVSLNETKRKKEREDQEKKKAIRKASIGDKDKEKDVYMKEAERILADLVVSKKGM
jgi:carboxyl-terminal processing protease